MGAVHIIAARFLHSPGSAMASLNVGATAPRRACVVFFLAGLLIVMLAPWMRAAQLQGTRIDTISPASGRVGDRVTITGTGFGANAVQVTVGGVRAAIVAAAGTRVTFVVPAGTSAGTVPVTVQNPGGRTSSIGFTVLAGVLLSGTPATPLSAALLDLPPVGVDPADVENGIIMTRLGARLAYDATVGQVNAALSRIGAGIVTMHPGTLSVTLEVPRQTALDALQRLAAELALQPGISGAWPAMETGLKYSRFDSTQQVLTSERFLLASRFPAAWNAHRLAVDITADDLFECRHPKIPLLMIDVFGSQPPAAFAALFPTIGAPDPPPGALSPGAARHGYFVTMVAGSPLGANPFPECLTLTLVQSAGLTSGQDLQRIAAQMPAGRFVVNHSLGYADTCNPPTCQPAIDRMVTAYTRANDGIAWKELTRDRWDDFLMVVAAGNEKDKPSAAIWPGAGDARFGSAFAVAAQNDPLLGFAASDEQWKPGAGPLAQGFASLATTPDEQARLADDIRNRGLADGDAVAGNVIVVGSTTNAPASTAASARIAPEQLAESVFSDRNSDVLAVGEAIFDDALIEGTSFAAPQVAGLASYMWLLSTELRYDRPAAVTRRAIVANTRANVIDAYASVLSLDAATLPTPSGAPIRLAILDVDHDGGFTDLDIRAFLEDFYFVDGDGTITREPPPLDVVTLKETDLNGDGFSTSISRRESVDLDRVGSTQFGQTSYGFVSQLIEGQVIRFDETALTDVEILCYYAYSAMYQGNPDARRTLLDGRCGLSIQPSAVTLPSAGQQQFTANAPVTWTATGGTISAAGLYTAGASAGTFTVQATSISDPITSASASVTITDSAPTQVTGPYDGEEERGIIGNPTDIGPARWQVQADGAGFRIVRESATGVFFCQQTGISPFQCTPTFQLTSGGFAATVGEKTVTGTLANGRLQFVLEEPCLTNTFQIVRCRTRFDGTPTILQVSPQLVDFGQVTMDTTSTPQPIFITNLGLLPIRVFVSVGFAFSIVGNSCAPETPGLYYASAGTTCSVSVQFKPTTAGLFEAPVLLSGDSAPLIAGSATLRGEGIR
jgi:hypothetical protein